MNKATCSNCGEPAKVIRGSYQLKESGLPVLLQGIEIVRCKSCGNEDPVIPNINEMMKVLALAVIHKPYRLKGEEVRFLRKYLKMTGEEFSSLIRVDKTTLSKWENNDDPVGEQSDRLIRAVTLTLGDGLKDQLRELIRSFPMIRSQAKKVDIRIDTENMSYQYA